MAPPQSYSYRYWRMLADGYEKGGLPIPWDVAEGLVQAQVEAQAVTAAMTKDWMVVDDAGREAARALIANTNMKPWAKTILNNTLQSLNIFRNGTTADAYDLMDKPEIADRCMGLRYLAIKRTCDTWWDDMLATHRKTKRFSELAAWMQKHGNRNHSYPKSVIERFCKEEGWVWYPTMAIGTGTIVHLRPDEVPPVDCLVTVSGTILAIYSGKLYVPNQEWIDKDITRGGTRAVYGYWLKP